MAKKNEAGGSSEQVELLRGIWNEMKSLNQRIDQTNQGLNAVRLELKDELEGVRRDLKTENNDLRNRVTESEVRLGTAVTQLSTDVRDLHGIIREWREEHRADRAELRGRVDRIEKHLNLHG